MAHKSLKQQQNHQKCDMVLPYKRRFNVLQSVRYFVTTFYDRSATVCEAHHANNSLIKLKDVFQLYFA